jgi:hypothetical protein
MHRLISLVLLAALTGPAASAADNKIATTFRDPERGAVKFAKIAVAVLSPDADLRRRAEGGLARRIRNSVAISTVVPDAELGDRDAVKGRLTSAGFDGAVIVRPVGVETEETIQHGEQFDVGIPSLWNYWETTWHTVTLPGYVNIDKIVTVEIAVYSVTDEKLIWKGRMTSTDPKSLRTFLDDLVKVGASELRKQKLL